MRPSLATDRLSWLLTYISFVVNHRWTFRSIIDVAMDSIHIERRIFSVNHSGAWCLQPRVHRDLHACATRYLMQGTIWDCNLTNDIKQCEIVLISIYSPRKTGVFSVPLVFTIQLHQSIGRKVTQPAALGASWPHRGCDWSHVAR